MIKFIHLWKVFFCFLYLFLLSGMQPWLQETASEGHIYRYLLIMQTAYIPVGMILALPVNFSSFHLTKPSFTLLTFYVIPCFLFLYVPFLFPRFMIFPDVLHADPYAGMMVQVLLGYGMFSVLKECNPSKNGDRNGRGR
ncbi:hypothetical protein [Halobacillus sp. Cin3]|uniref:hypothetical protein n=1 Tax=Halobacillus sp. Cin3 TaxID=2928441 RepID=UPI00248E7F26|nr:hypothetical protein [Halobacillus sp. Cin3]